MEETEYILLQKNHNVLTKVVSVKGYIKKRNIKFKDFNGLFL